MNQYTEIPDTSDTAYWQIKTTNGGERSQTFVPRDEEMHKRLKAKAWAVIQASVSRNRRNKS